MVSVKTKDISIEANMNQINQGGRPNIDLICVIDTSGSMIG